MINKDKTTIGWTLFINELEDSLAHLSQLVEQLKNDSEYDEADLSVDLGHVYSHLNRAWYRRSKSEDISELEWVEASQFPHDLNPL